MPTLLAKKSGDRQTTNITNSQPTFEIEKTDDSLNFTPTYNQSYSSPDNFSNNFSNNSTYNSSYQSSNSYQSSTTNLTQAGDNAATDAQVLVENDNTDWINKKWRPAMGWTYMITCICDFVVFPILWSILQALSKGQVTSQWQPVTLMGAGLYHVSMGAILGVTAFMRSKEKIEGKAS